MFCSATDSVAKLHTGLSSMAIEDVTNLDGKRILVAEDDFLLATDICQKLRDLGATVLGPAPTPFYAMQIIGRKKIDAAILDVRLHGENVFGVADLLQEQGVPILFATGCDRNTLPARFRNSCFLEKPLDRKRLITEIVAMTHRPPAPLVSVSRPQAAALPPLAPAQTFARALARSLV